MDAIDGYRVVVKIPPNDDDVRAAQAGWLWAYNIAQTNDASYSRLVIHLCDTQGNVVGGLVGEYYWGWLHIETVAMAEAIRGRGHGTQLLTAAEDDARKRGYRHICLETFSFQARPFYERLGYEVFGTLDDYPPGHKKYFMRKTLAYSCRTGLHRHVALKVKLARNLSQWLFGVLCREG
jgi:ribosomal protein S18 acetylase RimI-like enzyme